MSTPPRLAVVQMRPVKGAYHENVRRIGGVFSQLTTFERPPNIVVFPETTTSGYFLERAVADVAVSIETLANDLVSQHAAANAPPMDVVIGFYEVFEHELFNSAAYISLGPEPAVVHVHRKVFLPTYGLFDEARYVRRGHSVETFSTPWGRAAILICEDLWHSMTSTISALNGAGCIFVPSASPGRGLVPAKMMGGADDRPVPQSVERWESLARNVAAEHGLYVVMGQLVGFEGGKGFPGVSLIVGPDGNVIARGPLFDEAIVAAEWDPQAVLRAREASPLLADLRSELPHLIPQLGATPSSPQVARAQPIDVPSAQTSSASATQILVAKSIEPRDPMDLDPELVDRWLCEFVREEIVVRRKFRKAVVGLSGGVDSAVVAFVAARALGAENVIGIRMPYSSSSSESLAHAQLVADALEIQLETVKISAAVDGYAGALATKPGPARLGNVMARLRMTTLFDLAVEYDALPLGTGNKTERLLGYFTWHADDSPPINPIGDLFKTQVWALATFLGVPAEIVSKPATADLIVGQTDEGDLGVTYQVADRVLHGLLSGVTTDELIRQGVAPDDVATVKRRLDSTHWKRRLPTVAMMSQTAIGEFYLRPVDY